MHLKFNNILIQIRLAREHKAEAQKTLKSAQQSKYQR